MTISPSVEIPDSEPRQLIAGDTWVWRKLLADFPSASWTLTYYLQGAQSFSFAATADPDAVTFDIAVPAAGASGTGAVVPGSYSWHAKVSNSGTGEVYTIDQGDFRVVPNFATATPGSLRPNAEIMLAAVEAEIAARFGLAASSNGGPSSAATSPGSAHNEIEIDGRRLAKIPLHGRDGLYALRTAYKNEILMLENGGELPAVAVVFANRRGSATRLDAPTGWDGL